MKGLIKSMKAKFGIGQIHADIIFEMDLSIEEFNQIKEEIESMWHHMKKSYQITQTKNQFEIKEIKE